MTYATINALLGIDAIFVTLGVALAALMYVIEGFRVQGGLRRWNLLFAFILGYIAWACATGVGQDFARASDARLLSETADTVSLLAVLFFALVAIAILAADVIYWRKRVRSFASWLSDAPM